ncbi:MAG TPA: ABC transporter substrate-binding protein, partial [Chloroflexi bacterium]|nr:ABC transporter substrate-binding protein [Chloroflexota bacterium]
MSEELHRLQEDVSRLQRELRLLDRGRTGVQVQPGRTILGQNTEIRGDLTVSGAIHAGQGLTVNPHLWQPIPGSVSGTSGALNVANMDLTDRIVPGTKLRIIAGGTTQYYRVRAATYDTNKTVITLDSALAYTLTGTVASAEYCYGAPPDFIDPWRYQNVADRVNITGFASLTSSEIWVKRVDKVVFVDVHLAGESNSSELTFELPWAHASGYHSRHSIAGQNGSSSWITSCLLQMLWGSSTVRVWTTYGWGGWATSGTKSVMGQFF